MSQRSASASSSRPAVSCAVVGPALRATRARLGVNLRESGLSFGFRRLFDTRRDGPDVIEWVGRTSTTTFARLPVSLPYLRDRMSRTHVVVSSA